MEKRELICIGCPMGCPMTVELDNGEVVSVKGNTCKRGDIYARKEVTNPTRIVTSTVRVTGYTGLPAYLFVKITEDLNSSGYATCNFANGWYALTGINGVWYKELTSADVPGEDETYKDYPLLAANNNGYQITVSETLPRESEFTVTIKAYIGQKTVDYDTPEEVFEALTAGD